MIDRMTFRFSCPKGCDSEELPRLLLKPDHRATILKPAVNQFGQSQRVIGIFDKNFLSSLNLNQKPQSSIVSTLPLQRNSPLAYPQKRKKNRNSKKKKGKSLLGRVPRECVPYKKELNAVLSRMTSLNRQFATSIYISTGQPYHETKK